VRALIGGSGGLKAERNNKEEGGESKKKKREEKEIDEKNVTKRTPEEHRVRSGNKYNNEELARSLTGWITRGTL